MTTTAYQILVVDDEPAARDVLTDFFSMIGYGVITAANGLEALGCLQAYSVDLVISDIDMPRMDGNQLLVALREQHPDLPVLLITGKPSVSGAVNSLKTGATDYISKPFDLAHLREVVENALGGDESESEVEQTILITDDERTINGYRLVRTVNEGAMGVIYEAFRNQERYALKLMQVDSEDPEAVRELLERFVREAEIASRIRHPNVVEIFDYGICEQELVPYIVMEFVQGVSLHVHARELGENDLVARTRIILQIARALEAIHQYGICHRDVKPSNVLIDAEGQVKLTDFGVARPPESDLTMADQILGSPLYMAPESFYSSSVDCRADLFSLGVVAYQLYLGELPFEGHTLSQIATVITQDKPRNPRKLKPDFPLELVRILAKLLKKDPDDRFQQAADLIERLHDFQRGASSGQPFRKITETLMLDRDWC